MNPLYMIDPKELKNTEERMLDILTSEDILRRLHKAALREGFMIPLNIQKQMVRDLKYVLIKRSTEQVLSEAVLDIMYRKNLLVVMDDAMEEHEEVPEEWVCTPSVSTPKRKTKITIRDDEGEPKELHNFPADNVKIPGEGSGRWRVQNKNLLLIYKADLKKDKIANDLGALKPKLVLRGSKTHPYTHTRVFVEFVEPLSLSSKKPLMVKSLEPDVFTVTGKDNIEKVKAWVSDKPIMEETTTDLGKLTAELQDDIQACDTLNEANKKYGSVVNLRDIGAIWALRNFGGNEGVTNDGVDDGLRYQWHHEMWERLLGFDTKGNPKVWNHRRLVWIHDHDGGKDKSTFADIWQRANGGVVLQNVSGTSNIATLIFNEMASGNKPHTIFIDLPRESEDHKIYNTLECLLNGRITVLKYQGRQVNIGKCKLIVFSNFPPPFDAKLEYATHLEKKLIRENKDMDALINLKKSKKGFEKGGKDGAPTPIEKLQDKIDKLTDELKTANENIILLEGETKRKLDEELKESGIVAEETPPSDEGATVEDYVNEDDAPQEADYDNEIEKGIEEVFGDKGSLKKHDNLSKDRWDIGHIWNKRVGGKDSLIMNSYIKWDENPFYDVKFEQRKPPRRNKIWRRLTDLAPPESDVLE